jgi:hypothetical protein
MRTSNAMAAQANSMVDGGGEMALVKWTSRIDSKPEFCVV